MDTTQAKNKCDLFTFKAAVRLTLSQIENLLISAFEGGSNYWIAQVDTKMTASEIKAKREANPDYSWIYDAILREGGSVLIHIQNEGDLDESELVRELTLDKLVAGIQLLFDTYPRHGNDILNQNDDAITADVMLQLALFKEVLFG